MVTSIKIDAVMRRNTYYFPCSFTREECVDLLEIYYCKRIAYDRSSIGNQPTRGERRETMATAGLQPRVSGCSHHNH